MKILVLEAPGTPFPGATYATRLRERLTGCGHEVDVVGSADWAEAPVDEANVIVLTGGEIAVASTDPWMVQALPLVDRWVSRAARAEGPGVVGVCLGAQMIAHSVAPGSVVAGPHMEIGMHEILLAKRQRTVAEFHYEMIDSDRLIGSGGQILAHSRYCGVEAFSVGEAVVGMQFHPEFDLEDTMKVIESNGDLIRRWHADPAEAERRTQRLGRAWTPEVLLEMVERVRG